jgi:Tol biopolymer transport system component/DNA-binding winged helix-turn-helix (wHTH) protein
MVRFGVFELDVETGDLWDGGRRIRLQEQPRQVLLRLLAHPGELVTREELRAALWPVESFVDFEAGLNVTVNKLRHVLRDSASSPRFIETLPRRGYRFIAPISPLGAEPPTAAAQISASGRRRRLVAILVAALVIPCAMVGLYWYRSAIELPPMRLLPLTTLGGDETFPTLSPDGAQVAFTWSGDNQDNLDLYVTIPGGGVFRRLTTDPSVDVHPSWSPDGRQIAFVRHRPGGNAGRVFVISPLGGEERQLSDLPVSFRGFEGRLSWSPDGRYIAAARSSEMSTRLAVEKRESTGIHLIPTQGGVPRVVTPALAPASDRDPAFSPDGSRLAYLACNRPDYAICDVMIIDLNAEPGPSGVPHRLTSMAAQMYGLAWTRDGRSLVFGTEAPALVSYLWRVDSNGHRPPERLEVAGLGARHPATVLSKDRLVFARSTYDTDVYRFEPNAAAGPVNASSFPDFQPTFSPDGTRIAFSSARSGEAVEIWVAAADGSVPRQLTRDLGRFQGEPCWSPDGGAVAFMSQAPDGRSHHIWMMGVDEGDARQITARPGHQLRPTWSGDGAWIYFTNYAEDGDGSDGNVWRVAVADRREEQVTHEGGVNGFESPDRKNLVYLRATTGGRTALMSVPLTGGVPREMVECVHGFSVSPTGVHYYPCRSIAPASPLTRVKSSELWRLDPVTGRSQLIAACQTCSPGKPLGTSCVPRWRDPVHEGRSRGP